MKVWPKEGKLPGVEDLIDMEDPSAVFAEVCRVIRLIQPGLDIEPLRRVFENTMRLFAGQYPGYRQCNTPYHDRKHTTDCFMAMARLLHGASVEGISLSRADLILGLIAALHHDTGYIQKIDEISGTGAQFTLTHVDRSILFMEEYSRRHESTGIYFPAARNFLNCTRLDMEVESISFENKDHELIGKALGTADLLGQMAARAYIDRLPFLYLEFKEGNAFGFESEQDLMKATPEFREYTKKRLADDLSGVDRFMTDHFRVRWGIDSDLYTSAVEANIRYVQYLMDHHEADFRSLLRRDGLAPHRVRVETAGNDIRSTNM